MEIVFVVVSISFMAYALMGMITAEDKKDNLKFFVAFIVLNILSMVSIGFYNIASREEGVKEYIENPSAYKVDSVSHNGAYDHVEVNRLFVVEND